MEPARRIIPLQPPWLADPKLAAEELRRNAARITHGNAAELFRHPLPDTGWLKC